MLDWLWKSGRLASTLPDAMRGGAGYDGMLPQLEPWTDNSHLVDVMLPWDLFGAEYVPPISRAAAMRVPALARSRHLLVGAVAKTPTAAYRGSELVIDQPYWLYGSDGQLGDLGPARASQLGVWPQSTHDRMLWTCDDLLFHGSSVWLITRRTDPRDARSMPARMLRVPADAWTVDDHGRIVDPDGEPFAPDEVIVILGPHEGVLSNGVVTLRTAAELERTTADVAAHPFRLELHQTTDVTLSTSERHEIVAETRAALAASNGVLFTNNAIETVEHRLDQSDMLIGARNASALDIARHVSIPGAMIDATSEGASLEYQTTETRGQQFVDLGVALYTDAIAARLSMDDVVPAGQSIRFDLAALTSVPAQNIPTPD
jgi:hypothetical protein